MLTLPDIANRLSVSVQDNGEKKYIVDLSDCEAY